MRLVNELALQFWSRLLGVGHIKTSDKKGQEQERYFGEVENMSPCLNLQAGSQCANVPQDGPSGCGREATESNAGRRRRPHPYTASECMG